MYVHVQVSVFLTQALSPALIHWSYTLQILQTLQFTEFLQCPDVNIQGRFSMSTILLEFMFYFPGDWGKFPRSPGQSLSVSLADCETRNDTNWSLIILSVVFISFSLVKIVLFFIPRSRCHEAPQQPSASTAKQWLLWPPRPASLARQCSRGSKGWQKASKIWGQERGLVEKPKKTQNHLTCYGWGICVGMCTCVNICNCISQSYGWLYDNLIIIFSAGKIAHAGTQSCGVCCQTRQKACHLAYTGRAPQVAADGSGCKVPWPNEGLIWGAGHW